MNADRPQLDDCRCCEGRQPATPVEVVNRHGLSAIAYRAGVHPQFKESMLGALSAGTRQALAGFKSRDDDDWTIAFLDSWAVVADILTFYQERIANESYLRTATERRSLQYLARLIGYDLRPGVAAAVDLAFRMEATPVPAGAALPDVPVPAPPPIPITATPGVPDRTFIARGTRVQSVPGPGQTPQTFETVEAIEARAAWNAIAPRLLAPYPADIDLNRLVLRGQLSTLHQGDRLLLATDGTRSVKRIKAVRLDPAANATVVDLTNGHDPAATATSPATGSPPPPRSPLTDHLIEGLVLGHRWEQADLVAVAIAQGWSVDDVATRIDRLVAGRLAKPALTVGLFRTRAPLFGHNAPNYAALTASIKGGTTIYKTNWDDLKVADDVTANGGMISLDTVFPGIVAGSHLVLESKDGAFGVYQVKTVKETSRNDFTLSARVTQLELTPLGTGLDLTKLKLREVTVYAQPVALSLAAVPVKPFTAAGALTLDGAYLGLVPGRRVVVGGEADDKRGETTREVVTLKDVVLNDGLTTVTFKEGLDHDYEPATIRINANVAAATHGESRQEVLGSGDTTRVFQRFALRQPPLTYVGTSSASGAESTLEIRVNGIRWHEVPTLIDCSPTDRVYVTRGDGEGGTVVQFGDGVTGARVPTGRENVRAAYRSGIGTGGLVAPGQLSLLLTRPPGVRDVANPLPAVDAADAETIDDARRNAPLRILTLDRIVSLKDYEDFARAFAGIRKALASWIAIGNRRGVFLTVAGPGGAEVAAGGKLHTDLTDAIRAAGDPLIPIRLATYQPVPFRLAGRVVVDPDRITSEVAAAVEAALRSRFGFDEQEFGEPVVPSQIVAVIQAVPGVVAAHVTKLERSQPQSGLSTGPTGFGLAGSIRRFLRNQPLPGAGMAPGLPGVLTAAGPRIGPGGELFGAEILTLDPSPLADLEVTP
jgi:predicted phage baseplate assembly protein